MTPPSDGSAVVQGHQGTWTCPSGPIRQCAPLLHGRESGPGGAGEGSGAGHCTGLQG